MPPSAAPPSERICSLPLFAASNATYESPTWPGLTASVGGPSYGICDAGRGLIHATPEKSHRIALYCALATAEVFHGSALGPVGSGTDASPLRRAALACVPDTHTHASPTLETSKLPLLLQTCKGSKTPARPVQRRLDATYEFEPPPPTQVEIGQRGRPLSRRGGGK